MYEYVSRKEYGPVRRDLEKIIRRVQTEIRRTHHLTFQYQLIGSGRSRLVTRVKNGNGGYDFDYNLILTHADKKELCCEAEYIKRIFMDAFKSALRGTSYSFPEDSTSSITIKLIDKEQSKIQHSFDAAIVYYGTNGKDSGYYYLRNNKKQGSYEFAFRPLNFRAEEKAACIRRQKKWNELRKEYLKLKNKNEQSEKHSFSLYIEAVHNVYHQIFHQ